MRKMFVFNSFDVSRGHYIIKGAVSFCLNTEADLLSIRSHKQLLFGSFLDNLAVLDINAIHEIKQV